MNRSVWLIPPALVVGIASLAFVPMKRPPEAPAGSTEAPALSRSDRASYADQFDHQMKLMERARLNADEMAARDQPERATEQLQEYARHVAVAECLGEQEDRRVPFSEGKATCAAAVDQ
jgi:hypothetical protein